ncbi:MAG: TIGR00341 family protein [Candidatus Aminicenantes bacterium]|nr:TIGR00341 family protein [Candidatus Aminicenantes bacterium]
MSLRLIELVLPQQFKDEVRELLKENEVLDIWVSSITEGRVHFRVIVPTGKTEGIMDILEKRYSRMEGFRLILLPVEAVLPRPEPEEVGEHPHESNAKTLDGKKTKKQDRISRAELYTDIEQTTRLTWTFVLLVALSAIVASIGLLRGNIVYTIAAMVIAPLLGPNVALALGTTLANPDLSRKAVRTTLVGIAVALSLSALIGLVFDISPYVANLSGQTGIVLSDIVLALASGCAAVLSFTSGAMSALIGVMVAVALLPPLVSLGLLLGSGNWKMALGSLLLLLTNLICINLAGVVTFLFQGIRPLTWWESTRAKKATLRAILLWSLLLIALAVVILLS